MALVFPPDLPPFSEPYIPLVAREIMQRMIHQFAAEYTSKTTQDHSPLPNGTMKDQSLPRLAPLAPPPCSTPGSPPSSASSSPSSTPGPGLSPTSAASASGGTAAASVQNPVLSKLLMADQDGPLDLSVRKSRDLAQPCQQGEGSAHSHTHVSDSQDPGSGVSGSANGAAGL